MIDAYREHSMRSAMQQASPQEKIKSHQFDVPFTVTNSKVDHGEKTLFSSSIEPKPDGRKTANKNKRTIELPVFAEENRLNSSCIIKRSSVESK